MSERLSTLMKRNCSECLFKTCPERCFDAHPGSILALKKSFKGVAVVDEEGGLH